MSEQNDHRLILIPGQKKSGTTSLYTIIAQGCDQIMDVPKESGILALSPSLFEARLTREGDKALLLDATTTYFRDGAFPDNMADNIARFGKVTVLLMQRPERERLESHYRHALNFDGWRGSPEAFLASYTYLDHADLTNMVYALQTIGITDIRMLPFDILRDPQALRTLRADLLGKDMGPVFLNASNRFGGRQVIPAPIEKLVSKPFFQVILRPLLPGRLRQVIKRVLGRKPHKIDTGFIDESTVQAAIRRIDAANADQFRRLEMDR